MASAAVEAPAFSAAGEVVRPDGARAVAFFRRGEGRYAAGSTGALDDDTDGVGLAVGVLTGAVLDGALGAGAVVDDVFFVAMLSFLPQGGETTVKRSPEPLLTSLC